MARRTGRRICHLVFAKASFVAVVHEVATTGGLDPCMLRLASVTCSHLFRLCTVMKTFFFFAAVLVVCMRVGWAAEALQQKSQPSAVIDGDLVDDDPAERFITGSGLLSLGNTGGSTSITIGNAGYIALGAALLVPLIICLALLFYLYGGPRDSTSYSSSAYDSYARNSDQ